MKTFKVGDVIRPDEIQLLPDGAKISISESQYVVAELPEKSELEKLTDEVEYEGLAECRSDAREIAEWILDNFDRKVANPNAVIDSAGDTWECHGDGTYSYILDTAGHYQNWTLDRIRREIGICNES
jgi:hypothetical protein